MKNKITEEEITLWVDDQLEGERLDAVKAVLEADPALQDELLAQRKMQKTLRAQVPASIEPPYSDFFNSRIMREIEAPVQTSLTPQKLSLLEKFRWWVMPAAAGAMAIAFFAGKKLGGPSVGPGEAMAKSQLPSVYIPVSHLAANVVSGEDSDVNLIVLDGLDALPDEMNVAFLSEKSDYELVGTEEEVSTEEEIF